jgi:hypothetical protein
MAEINFPETLALAGMERKGYAFAGGSKGVAFALLMEPDFGKSISARS